MRLACRACAAYFFDSWASRMDLFATSVCQGRGTKSKRQGRGRASVTNKRRSTMETRRRRHAGTVSPASIAQGRRTEAARQPHPTPNAEGTPHRTCTPDVPRRPSANVRSSRSPRSSNSLMFLVIIECTSRSSELSLSRLRCVRESLYSFFVLRMKVSVKHMGRGRRQGTTPSGTSSKGQSKGQQLTGRRGPQQSDATRRRKRTTRGRHIWVRAATGHASGEQPPSGLARVQPATPLRTRQFPRPTTGPLSHVPNRINSYGRDARATCPPWELRNSLRSSSKKSYASLRTPRG